MILVEFNFLVELAKSKRRPFFKVMTIGPHAEFNCKNMNMNQIYRDKILRRWSNMWLISMKRKLSRVSNNICTVLGTNARF